MPEQKKDDEHKAVKISVYRHDPSASKTGSYQDFDVPVQEGMVVLDAINYIVNNYDTTLAVRWNCKAARCGSCAAEINGVPKLMCKTRLETLPDKVVVGPMRAFPLVKDLVTDVSENYDIERRMLPFAPKEAKEPWIINGMDVVRSQEFRRCIECFLCQDVCHVVRSHNTPYIGPRHVIKAASLDMHPMDTIDRSRTLTKQQGLGYCNVTKCCQDVCPEHIHITDNAIIPEKERAVDNFYDPIMGLVAHLKGKKDKDRKEAPHGDNMVNNKV
ncbi:succinate dehydrogenase and fumarate reductase iron-sulfur protein [mine drainage metagenome]|uniref:Succinate dehydrogenase and fumarate reductase iron-sulfur protein n=1 Tax=mine drainage metagenome TaxID=410659 RepID=T1B5N8_9ZZZZ